MSLFRIWERFLFKEFFKTCLFFTFSFYLLYVIIDYSLNSQGFSSSNTSLYHIFLYYLYSFIIRADILVPMALTVATIKVLYSLQVHHELVAFLVSGFRKILLLRPFFFLALLSMASLYCSAEFFLPKAKKYTESIERVIFGESLTDFTALHVLSPNDGSKILFQDYDEDKKVLIDAFWVRSFNEIYHMKELSPFPPVPEGKYVDLFTRDNDGFLLLKQSFEKHQLPFPAMEKLPENLETARLEELSLSTLWRHMRLVSPSSDRFNRIQTLFYLKVFLPLSCLLAIVIPASFCMQFSRKVPIFFIYALTFFGMLVFFTLMETAQILGESQRFPPLLVLLSPVALFSLIFGYRFMKIH